MKTFNARAKGGAMLACIAIMAATIFFSCKKNAAGVSAPADDMAAMAQIVNGETLTGSMLAATDEDDYLAITFNRGSKYVLLQKIPGMPYEKADEIKSAVLITSKYGVIIKDVAANKVWLFANNDKESLQKFETIKQQLHSSFVSTTVFGVTIVNGES